MLDDTRDQPFHAVPDDAARAAQAAVSAPDRDADGQVNTASPETRPTYLQALLAKGLLIATGVDGLYGRSEVFEDVVDRVNTLISAWGEGKEVEVLRFPPAMSRQVLEESGYWQNCPDQIGTVFSFCGDERSHQRLLTCLDKQDDWTEDVKPTRLAMTPAACYPVYPVLAARGPMPAGGRIVDILSYCSVMNRRSIRAACRCSDSANSCV